MTIVAGFKAAAAGEARNVAQSAEWLEGYDGFFVGRAENAAKQVALDTIAATIPHTRKHIRPTYSLTPRTLHLDLRYFARRQP